MFLSGKTFSEKSPASIRLLGAFGVAVLLSACQTTPQEPEPVAAPEPQVETPAAPTEQQRTIAALLSEADYALSRNKLLNPINDNAHDRYRSVLLMEPENERAKLGLQTIALRYVELARTSAVRGNVSEAQAMIKLARSIDNNPVVQDAAETMRRQVASMPAPKPYQASAGEKLLDGKQLQAKDPQLVSQLVGIAQQAKATDKFVLIIAKSDAEGRWIYQQLRSAVPGYLVRGDIKIGQPTRVKLVDSIE